MNGLILINAYSREEEYLYQSKRMKEELERLGVRTDIVRNNRFAICVRDGDLTYPYQGYDFCVYWDKDKYVLNSLDKEGMPLFNSFKAISVCDDKMTTYIELAKQGIPMPYTMPGLLCYTEEEQIQKATIDKVERTLGYPMVAKYSYGSLGKGVFKVDNREELEEKMNELKCSPHLFQKYVPTSYGRDVRVIVIGDKVVGGMLRCSVNDFRSNIGVGGQGTPFILDETYCSLSLRIAHTLGLSYCGVDFLFGIDGPVVCEVNSNAFFYAFERVTGLNVAGAYAEHICRRIYGGLPR